MKNIIIIKAISLSLLFLLMSAASCGRNVPSGPIVKIYISKPDEGGLVRKQDEENPLIRYEDSENYRCLSKDDFDELINYCFNPDNKEVGRVRKTLKKMTKRRSKKTIKKIQKTYNNLIENGYY